MNKGIITVAGYVFFLFGFLSILFSLVGLELTMLKWMSSFGRTPALILKLIMLFGGLIIMYLSKFPPQEEDLGDEYYDAESEYYDEEE